MKKLIPIGICILIAAVFGLVYGMRQMGWSSTLGEQSVYIRDLESRLEILKATKSTEDMQTMENATGYRQERVDADDEAAQEFLKMLMTWDSYDEYQAIRESCMTQYGLSENSEFMTVFLPEVVNAVAADGTSYNRIDRFGLNIRYERFTAYVRNMSGNIYSYLAFVTVSAQDSSGFESTSKVVFLYDMDSDQVIQNISAYTLS